MVKTLPRRDGRRQATPYDPVLTNFKSKFATRLVAVPRQEVDGQLPTPRIPLSPNVKRLSEKHDDACLQGLQAPHNLVAKLLATTAP